MTAVALVPAMLLAALVAGQEPASEPYEWDVAVSDDGKTVAASVGFDTGLAIGARCSDGVFEVILQGLPASVGERSLRTVALKVGDGVEDSDAWYVAVDQTSAYATLPARVARSLRPGGVVEIAATGDDERRRRYRVDLPSSPKGLDRVFTACEEPLVDSRDSQLSAATETSAWPAWRYLPSPIFPERALVNRLRNGMVTVSCVGQPSGRLTDCQAESEYPAGYGFGRAALQAARDARLEERPAEEGARLIVFPVTFLASPA